MEKYKKRILVTGGFGFIGSNFLNHFVPLYKDILFVNMDNFSHGSFLHNVSVKTQQCPNYVTTEYGKSDIGNKYHVNLAFTTYQITDVINFAAETHVDRSIQLADLFVKTNVVGVENLLKAFTQYVRYENDYNVFLQVSTDEVYGESTDSREQNSFNESDPIAPRNIYAASKAAAEHLVVAYGNIYGFKPRITRAGNNYGPNQDDSKLIPKMIKRALANEPFEIYGDGTNFRQWTHVEDHVVGLGYVLFGQNKGGVWNLAGKDKLTNNEVVAHIIEATGSKSVIKYIPDRPAHDFGYSIDCKKAREQLLWNPSIDFLVGIHKLSKEYELKQQKKG